VRHFSTALVATGLVAIALGLAPLARAQPERADAKEFADVRDFRVGMPLPALPRHGYTGFTCAADGAVHLAGWAEYGKCPADGAGLREVAFRYDDDAGHETKVAGQPVLLSLLMQPDGAVQAIRMSTDPSARLFLRKRGYLFGKQVMARYGEAGWVCHGAQPAGDEEPVGGVFLHERCEKQLGQRHLVVERELYRGKATAADAFVSRTRFTVSLESNAP